MKNLAIIPARSGSKGLKDKNIRKLNSKPLMAYSIEAALESGLFEEIMVSTDSVEYSNIAKKYGATVPFLRSEEKSNDTATSWEVVKEVLEMYININKRFDTICLLQPTSPLRDASDIIRGYDLLKKTGGDSVDSVCEVEHAPLWNMILPENLSLNEFNKVCDDRTRQELDTYYRLNGAIYIRRINYQNDSVEILNADDYALIMDRKKSVDIDTADDFKLVEFYMS